MGDQEQKEKETTQRLAWWQGAPESEIAATVASAMRSGRYALTSGAMRDTAAERASGGRLRCMCLQGIMADVVDPGGWNELGDEIWWGRGTTIELPLAMQQRMWTAGGNDMPALRLPELKAADETACREAIARAQAAEEELYDEGQPQSPMIIDDAVPGPKSREPVVALETLSDRTDLDLKTIADILERNPSAWLKPPLVGPDANA